MTFRSLHNCTMAQGWLSPCRLQEICTLHNVKMIPIATVDEEQFGKYFDFKDGKSVDP